MKPRIFISAVTSELASIRQLVANVLTRLGYDPVWQDIFGTESGDLRKMLKGKIDECDGLIHLVGCGYGAEPTLIDNDFGRVSYTQFEFLYAQRTGKTTWILFVEDGCTRNTPPDQLDLPRDFSHSDPAAWQAERRALQDAWQQRLKSDGHLHHAAANNTDLELQTERLKDEFGELRHHFRSWQQFVTRGLAVVAVLAVIVLGAVGAMHWQQDIERSRAKAVESLAEVERLAQEQERDKQEGERKRQGLERTKAEEGRLEIKKLTMSVQQLINPAVLADRIHKEIHATAEAKITAIPNEKGRGQLIAAIEQERDLALGRVDDLIKLIQEGLKEGASPIFQRAAEILQKEGTDAALQYLESRRPSTLETARRHAKQAYVAQARANDEKQQRNLALQPLVLEAELLETKLQWQRAIDIREQVAELAPDWFAARKAIGVLHLQLAHFREAETHLRAAVTAGEKTENEATALNDLAWLLKETNRWAEAEPMMRRALEIGEQSGGHADPRVAIYLSNLALLLKDTNRLEEAEPLMRRALAIAENFHGRQHRAVAKNLSSLASLLVVTNDFKEAEVLLRRALSIDEQQDRIQHPDVASDLNNLAQSLQRTNRLAEAELLMCRALAITERIYGDLHPHVAAYLNNLAQLFQSTNRMLEAEPLMRRSLAIDEQSYGIEHPRVASQLNNLAALLKLTNRLAEAEPLFRRSLAIHEKSYGTHHPEVACVLGNLALLLQETKRWPESEPLIRRALAIQERSYGLEHTTVAVSLNNLARLLEDTNRLAEAEALIRHSLAIGEQTSGAEHPEVAFRLVNLATMLANTSRLAVADSLLRRAVMIGVRFKRGTGHEYPSYSSHLKSYQTLLAQLKLPPEEIERRMKVVFEESAPLKPITPEIEQLLGPATPVAKVLAKLDRQYKAEGKPAIYFLPLDQPITPHLDELFKPNAVSINNYGTFAYLRNAFADAVVLFDEALELFAVDPQMAQMAFATRMNRGSALRELGDVEQARAKLRELIQELELSAETPASVVGRTYYNLALCEWRLGDREAAQRMAEKSLSAYRRASWALVASFAGTPEAPQIAPLQKDAERFLAEMKEDKPLPPLQTVDPAAELELALKRNQARMALTSLPLDQHSAPLLDQMLGPAKSTREVFETLDEQYRKQNKTRVWFLPLTEPIAPHLDELLGPVPYSK